MLPSEQASEENVLKLPSGPAFGTDVILCEIGIICFHIGAIPGNPLSGAGSDVAEKQGFGDLPLEFEIAAGFGFATFAGVQPLALVSGRTRQRLGWLLKILHLFVGNQPGVSAIECAKNFSAVPDEQQTLIFFFAFPFEGKVRFEFFRARWLQASVIPREFYRGHFAASGKVITNDGSHGIAIVITVSRTGLDTQGRFEFKRAENRIKAVRAHVAQGTAAEIAPPAPYEWQVCIVVGADGRGTEPLIPIQAVRDGLCVLGTLDALRPVRTAGPILNLTDGTNGATPDPFA